MLFAGRRYLGRPMCLVDCMANVARFFSIVILDFLYVASKILSDLFVCYSVETSCLKRFSEVITPRDCFFSLYSPG